MCVHTGVCSRVHVGVLPEYWDYNCVLPRSALNFSFSSFVVLGIKCWGIYMLSRYSEIKLHSYCMGFVVVFLAGSGIRVILDSE